MSDAKIAWDDAAAARLQKVPFFIRPLVRSRAERAARERGLPRVTVQLLDELKSDQHRGG
jgi:AdoMet-dependent heme synthase